MRIKLSKYILLLALFFKLIGVYSFSPKAEIPMGSDKYEQLSINYTINGENQKGYENFIQKSGKTLREKFIETKILSNSFKEHTLEIDDGECFYRINLLNKTGIKLPSLNKLKKNMIQKNPQLFKNSNYDPFQITPSKGKLKIKENILGKDCDGFLINNKVVFIWNNIILKESWEIFGTTIKIAEKLILDEEINDSVFNIPKGIKLSTEPEM
ncbi:MAG: hypothetical protein ACD_79C00386G0003 [uncultured bacterium]|nr:MAG: hypothetical protein ACD_79C00386G0003 [uncultured bacterium]